MARLRESPSRSPALFFALVFLLSVPIWLIGDTGAWQPLPGLPASAFMFVCPCIAAILLVARESPSGGLEKWLRREFDFRRARSWPWIPAAILLPPAALLMSYAIMFALGLPLPPVDMDFRSLPLVFLAFVISGLCEQLGWSSYAVEDLQHRWSALSASLLVGTVWGLWHIVPLQHAGRSIQWIAWWFLMTVALRVLLTWMYNNTDRTILAVALCQASANTGWQYFPNYGSHYDPRVVGLAFLLFACIATVIWGPRTLAQRQCR